MQYTTNYNLRLYDETDTFDIIGSSNSLNNNMEIIDQHLAKIKMLPSSNMKMMVFGDSISTVSNIRTVWMDYAPNLLGIDSNNIKNYALGGASYVKPHSDTNPGHKWMFNQIQQALQDKETFTPDIIVIVLGTNDYKEVNSGKNNLDDKDTYQNAIGDKQIQSYGTSSYQYNNYLYYSIRYAMYTLKQTFPYAKCFVSTPLQRTTREPTLWLRNAIIEMANRYNFIVMDAEYESGIVKDFEPGTYLLEEEDSGKTYGIHPNERGAKKLADYYSNIIINNIFKNDIINI